MTNNTSPVTPYTMDHQIRFMIDANDTKEAVKHILTIREEDPKVHEKILQDYFDHVHNMYDAKLKELRERNAIDEKEERQLKKFVALLLEVKGIQCEKE